MALIELHSYSIPAQNLDDGDYVVRYWYNYGFIDSAGQAVQSGTATTGTQIRATATVADGFLVVEDTQLYTTVDAQSPAPQSINLSCQVFKGSSALPIYPFQQSGCPSSWVIYNPYPDDFWEFNSLTFLQQSSTLAYPPATYPTTQSMVDYVNSIILAPASENVEGITFLDVDPDDPLVPIAVGVNSPLLQNITGKVVFASRTCVLDSNVITGGGTDDTLAIQAILDTAQTEPLCLVMDGAALVGAINVYGNTTIVCINDSCGFYLANATNRALLRNANPTVSTIVDKNITLQGGTYNGNRAHQTGIGLFSTQEADGTLIGDLQFYGVENLTVTNVRAIQSKTIGIHVGNITKGYFSGNYIESSGVQTGGIQVEGICSEIIINDTTTKSLSDDSVALSSDGASWINTPFVGLGPYVAAGPITKWQVGQITCDGSWSAFRIFNGENRIDGGTVGPVAGTITGKIFTNEPENVSPGNVGIITIRDVNISFTSPPPFTAAELIMINQRMDGFILRNCIVNSPTDTRSLMLVTSTADIGLIELDDCGIIDTLADAAGSFPVKIEGYVRRMVINSPKWMRANTLAISEAFLKWSATTGSIGKLSINGAVLNRVAYLAEQTSGFLGSAQLVGNHQTDTTSGAALRVDQNTLVDLVVSNHYGEQTVVFAQGTPSGARQRGDAFVANTTAPTFVSASVDGSGKIVTVIFSKAVNGFTLDAGVAIVDDAVTLAITSAYIQPGIPNAVDYVVSTAIAAGSVVTWAYTASAGSIVDWWNNPLANVGAQSVTVNALTERSFDQFVATDGTLNAGRTSSPTAGANPWAVFAGSSALQTIVSNTLKLDATGSVLQQASMDTTYANGEVTVSGYYTDPVSGLVGLIMRAQDANNYWEFFANSLGSFLYGILAGVPTLAASNSQPHAPNIPIRLSVRITSGNVFTCQVNGEAPLSITNATFAAATKWGLVSNGGPSFFDNWHFSSLP